MAHLKSRLSKVSRLEAGIVAGLLLIVLLLFTFLPVTYKDWITVFRPAALRWLTPYFQPGAVFNPPWLFPLLYPFALLPPRLGAGLLMLLSIIVVSIYVGSPKKLWPVILAAPVSTLFALGQLDGLLLLGLMIPHGYGIPLLLAKPQGVFLTILPRLNRRSALAAALIVALSIPVWGFWWQNMRGFQPNQTVNISLFPYTVLPGIILLYFGLKRRSDAMLCFASLCLAPYFMITSVLPAMAALVRETNDRRVWLGAIASSWVYLLAMRGFLG